MENRLKLRISRMFSSSLGSCRSRHLTDVVERQAFVPQDRRHYQLIELFSPKPRPRPLPSICRPKCSETPDDFVDRRCIKPKRLFTLPTSSDPKSPPVSGDADGRRCPPATPISPLQIFHDLDETELKNRGEKSKTMRRRTHLKKKRDDIAQFGSFMEDIYNNELFSSDEDDDVEDDDKTTLFSSKSLSSDSSDYFRRNKPRNHGKATETRRRRAGRKESEMSLMPLHGKVKDSFAVLKRSRDPYDDFRTSMVEMIFQKQLFGGKDLENLLQCFLSLNSYRHHRVIIEVFTEILDALFSDWS